MCAANFWFGLTALYNDSLKSCRLPSIWKTSLVIQISHPSTTRTHRKVPPTDPSHCYAQHPRSSRLSSYPLSTNFSHQLKIKTRLQTLNYICPPPAHNRHRDRLQPAHRTVCVAIDFPAAFDTVSHDILISMIVPAARHHSMAVLLSERETSCN